MGSYYYEMSAARLRDLLDELEERRFDLDREDPEDLRQLRSLEDLIGNVCELLYARERLCA